MASVSGGEKEIPERQRVVVRSRTEGERVVEDRARR